MKIRNKDQLVKSLISRVVENSPVREVLRVYAEAVEATINGMEDNNLAQSIISAGYTDLVEMHIVTEGAQDSGELEESDED